VAELITSGAFLRAPVSDLFSSRGQSRFENKKGALAGAFVFMFELKNHGM
jgi:hypothetical protein